jgi:hypothetical protein
MARLLFLLTFFAAAFCAGLPEAFAQAVPAAEVCESAEDCPEAARWGAWAMVAIGCLFFLVWFLPPRPRDEGGAQGGFTMMERLQKRIDREMTGWRRFQWPVLGVFFVGIGAAFLLGVR